MTNPTRTRAEIQAEIEKLQAELKAVPERKWKVGDRFYCEGKVTSEDDMDCAFVDVLLELERDETALYRAALIPADDLIPREEHEAALIEANTRTDKVVLHLNARDAIRYLVKEYALDAPGEPRSYLHYHNGLEYRVTVERVGTPPAVEIEVPDDIAKAFLEDLPQAPTDQPAVSAWETCTCDNGAGEYCSRCPQPANAEPVGWANLYTAPGHATGYIYSTSESALKYSKPRHGDETAVPLYRHPAPQPTTVAPKGVAKELRRLVEEIDRLSETLNATENYGWAHELRKTRYGLKQALARVIELPEPSEWAKEAVECGYPFCHRTVDELRDLAAALLAKEGE